MNFSPFSFSVASPDIEIGFHDDDDGDGDDDFGDDPFQALSQGHILGEKDQSIKRPKGL